MEKHYVYKITYNMRGEALTAGVHRSQNMQKVLGISHYSCCLEPALPLIGSGNPTISLFNNWNLLQNDVLFLPQ